MKSNVAIAMWGASTLLPVVSALGLSWGIGTLVRTEATAVAEAAVASPAIVATTAAPEGALSVTAYIDGIMRRNLFDVSVIERWAARSPGEGTSGGALTRSELRLELLGTIVAIPEAFSSAILIDEDDDQPLPLSYALGDTIQDRELVSIEHDRVSLRTPDGRTEVIVMGDGELELPSATSAPQVTTEDGVSQIDDNHFAVPRELFEKHINDLSSLSRMGRALLHRGPDGEYDGYRLSALRRNSLPDQLGIQNGDIIHSVNGEPLTSVEAAMGAYNTLRSDSNFCLEISRRGKPTELCYDVR